MFEFGVRRHRPAIRPASSPPVPSKRHNGGGTATAGFHLHLVTPVDPDHHSRVLAEVARVLGWERAPDS